MIEDDAYSIILYRLIVLLMIDLRTRNHSCRLRLPSCSAFKIDSASFR
jgi:hypothetical protein